VSERHEKVEFAVLAIAWLIVMIVAFYKAWG